MKKKNLLWKLFVSTFYISAFTFGGGYVIVSLMKKKFVDEYHWIEEDEMLDLVAIAQSSPGAIAVNGAIVVGFKLAGLPGTLVAILGKGSIVAEGTPFELKNEYVQDTMSVYGVTEEEIKTLGREYKKIRDGYQLKVKNTAEATRLIVEHQEIFRDYEVVKGRMDDVFLAVTGKTLGGEHR